MCPSGFQLEVEYQIDQQGEEIPRKFFIVQREVTVLEVLDRWPSSDQLYFKLRGDDEAIYLLRHDIPQNKWELIMYDSGKSDDTRLSST